MVRRVFQSASFRVLLTPVSSIVVLFLNIASMAVALRQGQSGSITAYTAGSSALAIVAVVAGGGASVGYATGDSLTRASIRRVRYTLISPILVVSSIAFGLILSKTANLEVLDVVLGGLSLTLFNLSQLDANKLQSVLRTWVILVASLLSRILGLVLVLGGIQFAISMFLVAILNYLVLAVGGRTVADASVRVTIRVALRSTYRGSFLALTLLDAMISKAPFLIAPYVLLDSGQADAFVVLVSAAHASQALLTSALFTIMTVEARSSGRVVWAARIRQSVSILSFVASMAGIALTSTALSVLGISVGSVWWILLMASMPFGVINRSLQYEFMAARLYSDANKLLLAILTVSVPVYVVSVALPSSALLAASHLIAEGCVAIGFRVMGLLVHRSSRPTSPVS